MTPARGRIVFRRLVKENSLEKMRTKSRVLWRSPLLVFALIGLLLALADWQWRERRKPEIRLTSEFVRSLERNYERQAGVAPDAEARTALVQRELEQELLYHESVKAGNLGDPRVKRLLSSLLRESLEPALPDPSDEELRAFRALDPSPYELPAEASFRHVSYPLGTELPEGLLARLQAGQSVEGDPSLQLANPLPLTFAPQLAEMFGADFVAQLQHCQLGVWAGPFPSARGVHFVLLTEYREARAMEFERVKPVLTNQWMKKKRADAVSDRVAEMQKNYRVILPQEDSK